MRMYDIIKKKRDGGELSTEEIRYFVENYTNGSIPDYQAAALCMAICLKDMNVRETTDLTLAVRDSGDTLHIEGVDGVRVDKHSTGGVGDKTSLVVAPIVASLGVKVAKMSGRGLGHTGGTVDKLESIRGFRTDLSEEEFLRIVNEIGIAIVGQSKELAPADKKLYALRDVIACVDSMPLIASSIMGKKLAADDDCIVLDVKTGSGTFMKTVEDSVKLAKIMVQIGKNAGKQMRALITDMDRPLGNAIGNALEVKEAIDTLMGGGPEDFREICLILASNMLNLAGKGSVEECRKMAENAIKDRLALDTFAKMVKAQGGESEWIYHPEMFPCAPCEMIVRADKEGYITHTDTEKYGLASLSLGAGRNTKEDSIDPSAGVILSTKTGDFVKPGDPIATLYASDAALFERAEELIREATTIADQRPDARPLVLAVVD